MRDSVPSGSYSSVCNVLRQWKSRSSLLIESTDSMIMIKHNFAYMLIQSYTRITVYYTWIKIEGLVLLGELSASLSFSPLMMPFKWLIMLLKPLRDTEKSLQQSLHFTNCFPFLLRTICGGQFQLDLNFPDPPTLLCFFNRAGKVGYRSTP